MFDSMLPFYNPNGDLPQYILGKADEDDYTGFPKVIMYYGGDEVFVGIAPDYEKSFIRSGLKDYEIKIRKGSSLVGRCLLSYRKAGRESGTSLKISMIIGRTWNMNHKEKLKILRNC